MEPGAGLAPAHLNQLVSELHIFEYWYHAASYLPMRDYRYALAHMTSIRNGENRYYTNVNEHLMKEILARVSAEGALRLRDLGKLFMQGDLMVCARNGMEKVYDLTV